MIEKLLEEEAAARGVSEQVEDNVAPSHDTIIEAKRDEEIMDNADTIDNDELWRVPNDLHRFGRAPDRFGRAPR